MFVLLVSLMMMMMMKSDGQSDELITARNGESILLTSELLKGAEPEHRGDVRWTHEHLVMSLKNNMTACHHGRCVLQSDGTLMFTRVQSEDAGRYILEVFDEEGRRLTRECFQLTVEGVGQSPLAVSSSVLVSLFLLLLLFIFLFILRRRWSQRRRTAGPPEENVYVTMHGNHGNKRNTEEEKKQEREEESHYVSCERVVSMETPVTGQKTVDEEDVYV
uniref:uncharacterized protein n=1 Tax=Semicossyphus pulcher TaxID=241346 RepID=UPI0037E912FC